MGYHSSYSDLRAVQRFLQSLLVKESVNTYGAKTRLRPQNKLMLPCREIAQCSLCWTSHHKGSLPGKETVVLPCKNIQHQFGGKGRWERIQMLPLHLWDLSVLLRLPAEQKTKCTLPCHWRKFCYGISVTAVNLPRGEYRHFSSPLGHFSFTLNSLALSSPALYDVQITPWTGITRGISEGVRHLNRSTDPDLSAYTSCTARSCLWIPIATFPLDHLQGFLLHYIY